MTTPTPKQVTPILVGLLIANIIFQLMSGGTVAEAVRLSWFQFIAVMACIYIPRIIK